MATSAEVARMLLAEPREVGALYGDVHHDNILDFGKKGWLAIDPKALVGEPASTTPTCSANPDLADPARPVATAPRVFARRLEIVSKTAGLERRRLLQWIVAWCGLSAASFLSDGVSPETDFKIAALALAELGR